MTSHVVTAVVAALVSGALCLGVGFTAITNGWVHVPTSSSLSDVKSNTSGSGSAKAKSGTAVDWTRWPRKCPIPWWPSTWRPATAKPRAPAW